MTRGENKYTSKRKQKQLQVSIVGIVVLYSCSCELYNVILGGFLFDKPLVARCAPRLPASGFQYYFPAQPFIHRAYALRYVLSPFQGFCSVQSSLSSCLPVC